MDSLQGRNVPLPVETEEKPRFMAGDVMPNGTVFDPDRHVILKNGVVRDKTNGQFVCAPASEHAPITQSTARAIAKKRWDDAREAFAAGMAEGMGKRDAPNDAWGAIGKKAAELLNETKSVRGFADLARFAGEASGSIPMARGREEMQEPAGEPANIMIYLAQFVQSIGKPNDVIEGELRD